MRFLADRYGEDKLWKLMHVQARSIFFPLWVNLRFWQAYDKTLSTLIDEFADEMAANLPDRGAAARAAGAARPPATTPATRARPTARRRCSPPTWTGPPGSRCMRPTAGCVRNAISPTCCRRASWRSRRRCWRAASASRPTRAALYFVALDLDPTYQAARLYRYDVDAGTLAVVNRDLRGSGGSLSPDGGRYVFARANGDHHDLAELDIATGAVRVIAQEPHGAYIANPRVSPDGKRIVATRFDGQRFRIVLIDARDGRLLATLRTGDDPVHDASWVDDHRVVFLAGRRRGRRLPGATTATSTAAASRS